MDTVPQTKIGPNTVRAWFKTVINPLIEALENQESYLKSYNWSWDGYGRRLALQPIVRSISRKFLPNFNHLVSFYPTLQTLSDRHGEALEFLHTKCEILFDALIQHPELIQKVQRIRTIASQNDIYDRRKERLYSFLRRSEEDIIQITADNIINHIQSHYGMRVDYEFWEEYRNDFLPILNDTRITPLEKQTNEAGASLQALGTKLLNELESIRKNLSEGHDVPFVDYAS